MARLITGSSNLSNTSGAFFRLLMCFFLTHPDSLKLFITTKLNKGLLPEAFGFSSALRPLQLRTKAATLKLPQMA
jgi:hypothetical protein